MENLLLQERTHAELCSQSKCISEWLPGMTLRHFSISLVPRVSRLLSGESQGTMLFQYHLYRSRIVTTQSEAVSKINAALK